MCPGAGRETMSAKDPNRVVLASPRGFCAGVVRAIDIVEIALERFGSPLYVRKEIVHNKHVVEGLQRRGVIFIDELSEAPDSSTVVFSAHGVSPAVREEADRRFLRVIDATCPLVTKVHLEALRFAESDYEILLIGHRRHEEVEGTMGEAPERMQVVESAEEAERVVVRDPSRVAYLTQTTLSMEDTKTIVAVLKRRFPAIQTPAKDDICYATQNRQTAVRKLAEVAPVILVIGSKNSSNSNRLVEEAILAGSRGYLIDDVGDIRPEWVEGASSVGITSGASAPDFLVDQVIDWLRQRGASVVEEVKTSEENVRFSLPALLQ